MSDSNYKRDLPECLSTSNLVFLPKGTRIFQSGDVCQQFFYLLQGSVRVDLTTKTGKAVMLYRFGAGETCVLTTACLLSGDDYCAEAVVEEQVCASVTPLKLFQTKLSQSSDFQRLVFYSFAQRLTALMGKIEEVAFISIDARLAARILQIHDRQSTIITTHEQLAIDLGTAREVISRKCAQWEGRGIIERGRGSLRILNRTALQKIATLGD